jgi:MFS family permease
MATSMGPLKRPVPRIALLTPLKQRDFALLWAGMTVSLLGDGVYLVAIAWQVYDLSGSPTALSLVGLAWSLGMVGFLLLGGAVADRVDRRRQMVVADLARGTAVLAIGVLAVTGNVQVWQLVVLSALFGIGEAFFSPAFSALIPQLVPPGDLVQANALQEVLRPATARLAGPALGGVLVALVGAGTAFLVDAASFAVAAGCVLAIRARPQAFDAAVGAGSRGLGAGLRFARGAPWFWASLAAVGLGIMVTLGPQEVLLPYVLRHDLHASAGAFGLVLAAGGVGGIVGGVTLSQIGLPVRKLRFMLVSWGIGVVMIAGYAVATAVWQLMVLDFVFGAGVAGGMVVWSTLMQTRVPAELRGRVSALDWLVSIGLSPVSFALTAPAAALAGADTTLLVGGLLGGGLTAATYWLVPALRADDRAAVAARSS